MNQTSLADTLIDPAVRPQAVSALAGVVEAEVKSRSGFSGVAIKAGYKTVTAMKPAIVKRAINRMLPDFAAQLDPFWASRDGRPFGDHLAENSAEVAEALLAVTDKRAADADHAALAKVYKSVRHMAKGMVEQALPRVGAAIESVV